MGHPALPAPRGGRAVGGESRCEPDCVGARLGLQRPGPFRPRLQDRGRDLTGGVRKGCSANDELVQQFDLTGPHYAATFALLPPRRPCSVDSSSQPPSSPRASPPRCRRGATSRRSSTACSPAGTRPPRPAVPSASTAPAAPASPAPSAAPTSSSRYLTSPKRSSKPAPSRSSSPPPPPSSSRSTASSNSTTTSANTSPS